jgi:hypothetical protein
LPIPPLNEYKLLPEGAHECELDEIESRFVHTPRRKQIWMRFIEYFELIKEFTEIHAVYVDGSFVADIKTPSDLDIAVEFVSVYHWGRLKRAIPELFDEKLIKEKWLLDFLPCAPEMMPYQGADARVFFQDVKVQDIEKLGAPKGTKKGILIVRWRGAK